MRNSVGGRNKRVIFQWQTEEEEMEAPEVSGGSHKAETPRERQSTGLQLPGSPDLPVPAATASAWKSWDLPLMLNHFLTRLLDHDSCKNGGLNAARR